MTISFQLTGWLNPQRTDYCRSVPFGQSQNQSWHGSKRWQQGEPVPGIWKAVHLAAVSYADCGATGIPVKFLKPILRHWSCKWERWPQLPGPAILLELHNQGQQPVRIWTEVLMRYRYVEKQISSRSKWRSTEQRLARSKETKKIRANSCQRWWED